MSKSELIKMGEKMGIDFDYITTQDKKAMRKAIAKAHKNKAKSEKAKGSIKMVSEKKEKTLGLQAVKDAPPYYFDEDTRDFVIPNADVTDDMNCFNAMKSLGHIRRQKREDDGFGTMMKKLQQLIDSGLVRNADLTVARLKVDEAQALLTASRLSFLPSLSLAPEGSISRFDGGAVSKTYALPLSADWEIDVFGRLRNAKEGARAVLMQSEAYAQAVQTQLVATVATGYYTLLMLDEQYAVNRQTAENWSEYVRTLRSLKKYGTVDEAAIAQAEAERLKTESSLLALQKQIQSAENALSVLLGRVPSDIRRGTLSNQEFPEELAVGVPLQLLRNRPDVREKEWLLAQAYYVTNEARAAFYPQITLRGSVGWTNNDGGGIVNPGSWLLQAIGSLVQPLFNRGNNIAQLKVSKAQQQEALVEFQQSILEAGAEVNDALTQWQTARRQQEYDRRQIEALETALKSTQLLMDHGTVNYLEVLTVRQSLLQARLTAAENKYSEIEGVILLYHALGGGTL